MWLVSWTDPFNIRRTIRVGTEEEAEIIYSAWSNYDIRRSAAGLAHIPANPLMEPERT